MTAQKLVLFDIDGTLVLDDGIAREAFRIALEDVYDYTGGLDGYDFSGRTDPQISHMVLGDTGLESERIAELLPRLWDRYLAELSARADRQSIRVLRGVRDLLEALQSDRNVTLGLLTGNIEPGARTKLAPHQLNEYFPFGAFGSDSMHREELPPIAIRRAGLHCGRSFSGRDVVIIGDSIYDVRCGVPHGATTIAVASGRTTAMDLEAEKPDLLIDSLEESDAIFEAIGLR